MTPGNKLPGSAELPADKPEPSVEGDPAETRYRESGDPGNGVENSAILKVGDDSSVEAELMGSAPEPEKKNRFGRVYRSAVAEIVILVVLAFALAMTTKTYVVEAYEIKGRSMVPTFEDGQRVVVFKLFSGIGNLRRGDIVIFSSQDEPGKDLIKRVVAFPGERIRIRKGKVRINGELLTESYLEDKAYGLYDAGIDEVVSEGEIYVLGDNRDDSHDSRRFGSVSGESLKGKVIVRWWPVHEVKTF
tara:strand:+ start:333 stop:1070 length:738 start_codon:yes stop_codon:yes gene_type:complete